MRWFVTARKAPWSHHCEACLLAGLALKFRWRKWYVRHPGHRGGREQRIRSGQMEMTFDTDPFVWLSKAIRCNQSKIIISLKYLIGVINHMCFAARKRRQDQESSVSLGMCTSQLRTWFRSLKSIEVLWSPYIWVIEEYVFTIKCLDRSRLKHGNWSSRNSNWKCLKCSLCTSLHHGNHVDNGDLE